MSTADSSTLATLLEHRDWVRSLARSLVSDPSLAEDIAQRTMLEAIERPPAGGVRNPRGWLTRVARNVVRGEARAAGRRRTREEAVAKAEASHEDPARAVERAFAHRRVVDVLLSLDEPYRTVLTQRYFEGVDPREIAKQLDRPLATVRSQIQRGLTQMREKLDHESDGDRTVWIAALTPLLDAPSKTAAVVTTKGAGLFAWIAAALALFAIAWSVQDLWSGSSTPPQVVDSNNSVVVAEPESNQVMRFEEFGPLSAVPAPQDDPVVWAGRVVDIEGRPLVGRVISINPKVAPRLDGTSLWTGGAPTNRVDFGPGELPFTDDDQRRAFAAELGFTGWRVEAIVQVLRGEEADLLSCRTDAEGRYRIEIRPGDLSEYYLVANEPDQVALGSGRITSGPDEGEFVIVVGPAISLRGTVRTEAGLPIPDVLVGQTSGVGHLPATAVLDLDGVDAPRRLAVTDALGRFSLKIGATDGETVRLERDGFVARTIRVERWAAPVEWEMKARPVGDLISGVVLGFDGEPLPGARVSFGSRIADSDEQGRFELEVRRVDESTPLTAWKEGVGVVQRAYFGQVYANRPELRAGLVLRLSDELLEISGRALGPAGQPLKDALVYLWDGTSQIGSSGTLEHFASGLYTREMRTDGQGRFTIRGLFPRSYRVQIVVRENLLTLRSGPIEAGSRDVEIRASADALMPRLEGVIVDRRGRPFTGVKVGASVPKYEPRRWGYSSETLKETVQTDADGRFVLKNFPADLVELSVDGEGVTQASFPLEDFEAEGQQPGMKPLRIVLDRMREFRLRVGGGVEGDQFRLVDADGKTVRMDRLTNGRNSLGFRKFDFPGDSTAKYVASESAIALELWKDGKALRQIPIRLDREGLITIDI